MTAPTPESLLKTMADPIEPLPHDPDIEYEWQMVSHWPDELRTTLREIPDIEHVLRSMRKPDGHAGAGSETYHKAIDVLEQALTQHRESLAAGILAMMGISRG